MRRAWRDDGLSMTLVVLFLGAWTLQTWTGWLEFAAQQRAAGAVPAAFGDDGYVWSWAQATFENWQSEFLQVFIFVVLTTFLVHRERAMNCPTATTSTSFSSSHRGEARCARSEGGAMTDERAVDADAVRKEHEAEVRRSVQWAYLVAVLSGGLLLMLGLIGLLGANAS